MQILLTNDDGVYAPGLAALVRALSHLGDITVVAPATEQSGVGHAITYLSPLLVQEIFDNDTHWGWAVHGSPADCVKLAVAEFCPVRPDLVVSGINSGLNAGINVLYSGTVAAAIEGAFFGITSIAVSLQFDEHARYDRAARLAVPIIEKIISQQQQTSRLYNLNIPTAALERPRGVRVVPMDVARWGEDFESRLDPRGRRYFWATGGPPQPSTAAETDLSTLAEGDVSLTPLEFDMTQHAHLETMRAWQLEPVDGDQSGPLDHSSSMPSRGTS